MEVGHVSVEFSEHKQMVPKRVSPPKRGAKRRACCLKSPGTDRAEIKAWIIVANLQLCKAELPASDQPARPKVPAPSVVAQSKMSEIGVWAGRCEEARTGATGL